jgi:23S rRNA pseudouridine2605 synthase
MEELRIHKYIADLGIMSRRQAEEAVKAGEVRVNGERAEIGMKINPLSDKVEYKGRELKREKTHNTYIMLNKPVGYVTTMNDEKGRACVKELVSDIGARVYPVGRLDLESEGLLLMTNDGELTNRLTHPKHHIPKYYNVTVKGQVTVKQRKELSLPMDIDGYTIQPVKNEVVSMDAEQTVLKMELYEGRNRQIRKMCETVGLEILRLKRIAIGNISLGNLKSGAWRRLTKQQIDYLKTACGLKK